jgi:hypothetical protein
MDQKKRIALGIALVLFFLVLVTAVLLLVCRKSRSAVFLDNNNMFYTVKNLSIIGNTCIGLKSDTISQMKSKAMENLSGDHSLSIISLSDVCSIEFMAREDTKAAAGAYPTHFLGMYKVTVTGHAGFLFLREDKGNLYGAIRFPRWGRGVNEYIRSVQIKNNQLFFTRSATTIEELKRIGGNTFFVQRYMGTYYDNGKSIRGFYFNDRGEKNIWEGVR